MTSLNSKRAEVSKAWRENNRRIGRCVGCTKRAPKKFALCKSCRQARMDFMYSRIRLGLCTRCKNTAAPGRKKCFDCVLKTALYDLKRKGLPQVQLDEAAKAFRCYQGICECCGLSIPLGKERFDHDDKQKKFRGIICHGCNVSIGFAEEDPSRLEKAARYLRNRK